MAFVHHRTIRFADTDAAGVVYFANLLSICHEAYEAALAAAGINLKTFFRGETIAIPIVHAEADYWQPFFCGEVCVITLSPVLLSPHKFEIRYRLQHPDQIGTDKAAGQAQTLHICIDRQSRERTPLPPELHQWLTHIPSNPDISGSARST